MKKTRRHNDQQSISDVLKDFVVTNKLQKGINQVEVEEVWKRVMGPAISKYTTQIKLQRETLFVQLSSSVPKNYSDLKTSILRHTLCTPEHLQYILHKKAYPRALIDISCYFVFPYDIENDPHRLKISHQIYYYLLADLDLFQLKCLHQDKTPNQTF